MSSPMFSLRIALVYAVLFAGIGIALPWFPVWLKARGLDAGEIAAIVAAQILVRVVTSPALTFLADRTGRRGVIIVSASAVSGLALAAVSQASGFWPIFVLAVIAAAFAAPVVPLVEALVVDASHARNLDYGRLRVWGSLSFIATALATGSALERFDAGAIIWFLVAAQALLTATVLLLPGEEPAAGAETVVRARVRDVPRLLFAPLFLLFLAATAGTRSSHAMYDALGTVNWQRFGIGDETIGILWSIGVIAEVALFLVAGRVHRRIGSVGLIATGAAGAVLRWAVYAFDPPLALLLPLQALHAASFGMTHLGTMFFIRETMPKSLRNTAQGLHVAIAAGVATAAVTLGTGPLYEMVGGLAYLAMAALAALSLAACLPLGRSVKAL